MTRKLENHAPNPVTYSVKCLALSSAHYYHTYKKKKAMMAALDRIQDENEQIEFLMKYKYFDLAHPLLRKQGESEILYINFRNCS